MWQALDPAQRRQQTLGAVKRLLLRESRGQPLILLFEDLHWIDSETQTMLESLVESLPTTQLLLLVNYRPEYQHGWANKTYYSQLRLDPACRLRARGDANSVLGNDHGLQSLKQLLIERTRATLSSWKKAFGPWWRQKFWRVKRGNYHLEKRSRAPRCRLTVSSRAGRAALTGCRLRKSKLLQSAAVIGQGYSLLPPAGRH